VADDEEGEGVVQEHPSSSRVQREAELVIVGRLGKDLGVDLVKKRITYHGSIMEIDGVAPDFSIFVEAFARIGAFKPGQFRKVSTDALKLISLQADHPKATFVLAFVDQVAMDSLKGWQLAVLDYHDIERRVVKVPKELKRKLREVQASQKKGMQTVAAA
jgi:hypothetical protein